MRNVCLVLVVLSLVAGYRCDDPCANVECDWLSECTVTQGVASCTDKNECDYHADRPNGVCEHSWQVCVNYSPGWNCVGGCEYGACGNQQCSYQHAYFLCSGIPTCGNGYKLSASGYYCQDIDECFHSNICGDGYNCRNSIGSYACNDIDECQADQNPCAQFTYAKTCINTPGSYICESTPFYIQGNLNGYVLEPVNSSLAGSLIAMQPFAWPEKLSQQWNFTSDGHLINCASGLALDISGGSSYPGATPVLWTRKVVGWAANQQWAYDPVKQTFTSKVGKEVLDIRGANKNAGATLCMWTPNNGANQGFNFQAPDGPLASPYKTV